MTETATKTNAVATKKESNVVTLNTSLLEMDQDLGFKNMEADDLALPFLKILAKMSGELDEIEGAKAGMIFNTVTREIYSGSQGILVIPCAYERKLIEWEDRGQGNGYPVMMHPVSSDILSKTVRDKDNKDRLESGNYIENTAHHYVLLLDEKSGGFQNALVTMKGTQLKKSRKWNSLMASLRLQGKNGPFTPAPFAYTYRLRTVEESKDSYKWHGWDITREEQVKDPSLYDAAKKFYTSVVKGEIQAQPMAETENNSNEVDKDIF
tara:strand:- start:632 stop:1429 length:798 start_codon:yes stop_codon:yes gene_type:complete